MFQKHAFYNITTVEKLQRGLYYYYDLACHITARHQDEEKKKSHNTQNQYVVRKFFVCPMFVPINSYIHFSSTGQISAGTYLI